VTPCLRGKSATWHRQSSALGDLIHSKGFCLRSTVDQTSSFPDPGRPTVAASACADSPQRLALTRTGVPASRTHETPHPAEPGMGRWPRQTPGEGRRGPLVTLLLCWGHACAPPGCVSESDGGRCLPLRGRRMRLGRALAAFGPSSVGDKAGPLTTPGAISGVWGGGPPSPLIDSTALRDAARPPRNPLTARYPQRWRSCRGPRFDSARSVLPSSVVLWTLR
jgi:hypothetical protein